MFIAAEVADILFVIVRTVGSIDKHAGVGQMIDGAYKVGQHYHLDKEPYILSRCVVIPMHLHLRS